MSPRDPFAAAAAALAPFTDAAAVLVDLGLPLGPDLGSYDYIILAISGGADSVACLLTVLLAGVDRTRLEIWHHAIDGQEGSTLMDWPCTTDYVRKLAQAFDIPFYMSWRVGGLEGELDRNHTPTGKVCFETPKGLREVGGKGPEGKRGLFPQESGDLKLRWCSPVGKIDVSAVALRNQDRFEQARTLFVTGERAEEGPKRARYNVFEPQTRTDRREGELGRHVDHYRPVHHLSKCAVWALLERFNVNPHPCYKLGWGRCSCAACIFGNKHQWASLRHANPAQFRGIAKKEALTGQTIKRSGLNVIQLADRGTPYPDMDPHDIETALSPIYNEPIFVYPWTLPKGAYGDSCGPT